MTDEQIINAVVKLDEWVPTQQMWNAVKEMNEIFGENYMTEPPRPKYLTSWDAIVPVIEKHWQECSESSQRTRFELCTPPRELCILLLKATGGWIDEEKVVDNPSSVA